VENEHGELQIYRIVGPDEFDLSHNKLSMDSPLARALLGKRVGDDIVFSSPAGEREFYIEAVSYSAPA
jgi:transcription elongation factor GreB